MANSNVNISSLSKIRGKIVSDIEANLSVLFDATDELILLFSNDETILTLNSKAAESIGYPVEALIGKKISDLLPPEVILRRRPFFDQVLNTGKPCFFEDSRNNRWFYNRIFPTIDENGKVVCMAVYTREITDERLAKNALIESEEKYRRLFESASLGIFQSTPGGQVISVNPKFASMFGYDSPEDVKNHVQNTSTQLFADSNRRDELIQQMKENPGLNSFENLYKRKDGSTFEGQMYISLIRDEKGEIDHLEGFVKDITKRKINDELLRESEEKFRNFFENSIIGKSMTTLDGKLNTNKAYCDLLGYEKEEISSLKWQDLTHPDDIQTNLLIIDRIISGEMDSFQWEKRYIHKKGHTIWVHINIKLERDKAGAPLYFITSIVDITEKKQNEEEIKRKNQELTLINAEKDKFFSIVTHDLRGPFNSIMGFTQLLSEIINEKENPEIAEYANIIRKSSEKAMDLLNNLMDWTRSQTGRMKYNPEYFELTNFLQPVLQLFDEISGQKSISITKNLPASAPVFADKAMIGTIFRNLVSNAIKFTRQGGEVAISAEVGHKNLTVEVRDNGIGIPYESIKKLFRIDQNFSTQGTSLESGTGLGLILCKEFVDKNKGKIWVESEEGKGSTFYFTIPRNEEF
ncbi:MAG: PAS domain S-box protein [Prolixibacteraceae bacterium]|jgi:PAS domain S-box-containing protein|nr:PAS domain S-box protein [Prolixibacteraceae bacterium]